MKVDISPRAYEDLAEIKEYISVVLQNPNSAKEILQDIMDAIRSLDELPDRGGTVGHHYIDKERLSVCTIT